MSDSNAGSYPSMRTTHKRLVNIVRASSATSAGARQSMHLLATPARLWFLPRIVDRRRNYPSLARCSVGRWPRLNSARQRAINQASRAVVFPIPFTDSCGCWRIWLRMCVGRLTFAQAESWVRHVDV